jgi:phosphopantetheine adenylyltransferase
MDSKTKMLSAIMKRYGSLTNLLLALKEDEDTVLVNLDDDVKGSVPEKEWLDYINLSVGWNF